MENESQIEFCHLTQPRRLNHQAQQQPQRAGLNHRAQRSEQRSCGTPPFRVGCVGIHVLEHPGAG